MSRGKPKEPRHCFQKIIELIESHAPNHKAGWWNLDQDDDLLTKRVVRQIYTLARQGRSRCLTLGRQKRSSAAVGSPSQEDK